MNDDERLLLIERAAEVAHEINRIYCQAIGDTSQVPWAEAPDWQKSSARAGVIGVAIGYGPEQSHEGWLAQKRAEGWKYGPVKNPDAKEHPCFVPYAELPEAQKAKDALFVNAVRGMLLVCGEEIGPNSPLSRFMAA